MKLQEAFGQEWYDKLKPFLTSKEFIKIGKNLNDRIKAGEQLNPDIKNIFDTFKWCPYSELRVVFLFDDFTIDETKQEYFWSGIENEVYNGLNLNLDKSLQRLGNQGVMFLSKSLTQGDEELWKYFYNFVVETIKEYNSGIIFAGDFRQAIQTGIFNDWSKGSNFFLPCQQPFSKNGFSENWNTGGIFQMINSYLEQTNNTKIEW